MALWKIEEIIPVTYHTCEERPCSAIVSQVQGYIFCNGTNLYAERLSRDWKSAGQFYYYPAADNYQLDYPMDFCYGAGIRRVRWGIPADGRGPTTILGEGVYFFLDLFLLMSRRGIEVGSYGKLYCTVQFLGGAGGIGEIDPYTLLPVDGGWAIPYSDLTDFWAWGYIDAPGHSIVNREDGILMLNWNNSSVMHFWDISGSPPYDYLGKLTAPGNIADVSYEDRFRFWLVTQNGYVVKINYQLLRTELLSEVQNREATDLNYLVAWDQKRFRLAVFRHKPDAADGACTSTLEFYRPLPKVDLLTDPVPTRPLRWGQRIPMSFHLVGTAGEGIAPATVAAALQAPVDGALARSSLGTGQYGVGAAEYLAPLENCEETLTLTATVTDGQ